MCMGFECTRSPPLNMDMTYTIRYVPDLDSNLINNTIAPADDRMEIIKDWLVDLEKSILDEGIRNPVVLTQRDGVLTSRYGGTRTMLAQKHNLKIPAVIADFDDVFEDYEKLETWEIDKHFQDKPKKIRPKANGINMSGLPGTFETY